MTFQTEATLIAQIVNLVLLVGIISGVIFVVRTFRDLRRRIQMIEEKLNIKKG